MTFPQVIFPGTPTTSGASGVLNPNGTPPFVGAFNAGTGVATPGLASPFSFGSANLPANFGGGFGTITTGIGVLPSNGFLPSIAPSATNGLAGLRNTPQVAPFATGGMPLGTFGTPTGTTGVQGVSPFATGAQRFNTGAVGVPAFLQIDVPANAQLFVQGVRINQGGPVRQFVTPNLPAGSTEGLTVHAVWTQNGREVSATQQVFVNPGEQIGITLMNGVPTTAPTTGNRP
jgi:uncharacterized protein (TIGR03000 family)